MASNNFRQYKLRGRCPVCDSELYVASYSSTVDVDVRPTHGFGRGVIGYARGPSDSTQTEIDAECKSGCKVKIETQRDIAAMLIEDAVPVPDSVAPEPPIDGNLDGLGDKAEQARHLLSTLQEDK